MTQISLWDRAAALLADLIAIPSVNPMGQPRDGDTPIERPVIEYLERKFIDLPVTMERQSCGEGHESVLITLPGQTTHSPTLFEAHLDTVPANEWSDRAFVPRFENGRIYGRGACDNKGSLCAMVLALQDVLAQDRLPPQGVVFLGAGDEEYAQSGIKQFLNSCPQPIGRAIIGEPTSCKPVIQHKGVARWDIIVHGKSAHTARPELGRNAIVDAMQVVAIISEFERDLRDRFTNRLLSNASMTVTQICGGRACNIVPDKCEITIDFRTLPEMDSQQLINELKERIANSHILASHGDFQAYVLGLSTASEHPFTNAALDACNCEHNEKVTATGAPYFTDASWLPTSMPTIVLGPGDIEQAHAVGEYVELSEVVRCSKIYRTLMLREWAD